MNVSLRALLANIVDYAGLFPPAELPLEDAVASYGRHLASPEAWMLSRFICPVPRLPDAEALLRTHAGHAHPVRISGLLRGSPSVGAFLKTLDEDLARVEELQRRVGDAMVVDVFETRFPADLYEAAEAPAMREFLDDVAARIDASGVHRVTPYYEAGFAPAQWREALPALAAAIGEHDRRRAGDEAAPCRPAGFKLRCGGVTDDAFPSIEEVAFAIATCRDHAVPMKFTAGLHHPLRHFNEGQQVTMHGFLNVFTAGLMAWSQKLPVPRIRQILEDGAPDGFMFDGDRFSWKGYTMPADEVAALRERAVVSFGSCSFDEPREDLRTLGLLPAS